MQWLVLFMQKAFQQRKKKSKEIIQILVDYKENKRKGLIITRAKALQRRAEGGARRRRPLGFFGRFVVVWGKRRALKKEKFINVYTRIYI